MCVYVCTAQGQYSPIINVHQSNAVLFLQSDFKFTFL